MTTVSVTTVEEQAKRNRVMSIRKKFETLCHLEHLDISVPDVKPREPKYLFQRSATTFNLSALRNTGNNKENGNKCSSTAESTLSQLRKSMRNGCGEKDMKLSSPSQPTAMINQTPPRLIRQSSDPRRASIKRSPAFRVGETHQKNTLSKSSSLNDCQQLTDTLKKALRQPLPAGPPPKKPPRLLASPTATAAANEKKPFPIQEEEKDGGNGGVATPLLLLLGNRRANHQQQQQQHNNKNGSSNGCWSKKLANGIKSNVNQLAMTTTSTITRPSAALLCCNNNNSANIYDDVASSCYYKETQKLISNSSANGKNGKSEPIYMEPFQHLKMQLNGGGCPQKTAANCKPAVQQRRFSMDSLLEKQKRTRVENGRSPGSLSTASGRRLLKEQNMTMMEVGESGEEEEEDYVAEDSRSVTGSVHTSCSCPEQHTAAVEKLDLHYLCTTLSDRSGKDHLNYEHDNDPPMSLGKTYDEINLLVNAAFNKRVISPSNSSMDDDGEQTVMGNNSVSAAKTLPSSNGNGALPKQTGKLTRSLTEKRKDYVRRISIKGPEAIPSMVSNNYGSLNQTFKSPVKTFAAEAPARTASPLTVEEIAIEAVESTGDRIKRFQKMIRENGDKNGGEQEEEDDSPKLFKCCLLVGFNLSTNLPYKKFVYPARPGVVPQNIEHLIFPTRHLLNQKRPNQEYSLILTDNNGAQVYGYCRRVLPENCEYCLPLAYCIVSEKKAPGFYFRVLKEIEVRHGQTESQAMVLLRHLHSCAVPEPGKVLHVKVNLNAVTRRLGMVGGSGSHKVSPKRMSLEVNPKWLTEASMTTLEKRGAEEKKLQQSSGSASSSAVDEKTLSFINRGMLLKSGSPGDQRMEEILIRRPTDLRLESTELSTLYESLGSELLLHAFSSLLLERKVILFGENIAIVTSCVLGLQTILYPFKWQHTLVTILPENLLEICQAPFPVLAGTLTGIEYELEDGLVIDVDRRLLVQHCGDEFTILPPSLRSSLLMSLEMVNLIDQGKMLSNVLIAEAFLRFFVELFANYKQKTFNKEVFIESHPLASVNLFLEWFVETSFFRHILHNKAQFKSGNLAVERVLVDEQLEANYYDLFDAKLLEKAENKSKTDQSIENIMKNCKLINKKTKTFKERFKHFFD